MLTVIGHINPDTDSTCSAIVCAHYLSTVTGSPAVPAIAGPLNKEATFVLNHFSVPAPEVITSLAGLTIAIVDTNNPDELLPGWETATITGIIDHHKLAGGLSTPDPITIIMRPVACTATLLHDLYVEAGATIPKEMAGLMLAAILSDTLNFSSPTTTNHDRQVAETLASYIGENCETLSAAMFAAKSDLTGMSVENIVTADSKVYTMNGKKVFIGTHETTAPQNALALRGEIESTLTARKTTENLDYALFFIIDIMKGDATLITPSQLENDLALKAFGSNTVLPGVVSRKKQIVPKLESALA